MGVRAKPMGKFQRFEATTVKASIREMEDLLWRLRSGLMTAWPHDIEAIETELERQKTRLKALLEPADNG